ncbi:MAG: zinc-ribbon domain-containing protein, partial [Methanobacteriota archaeon]
MQCPSCSAALSDDAAFCPSCGWKVAGDPIDRAAHNLLRVSREVLDSGLRLAGKTAKAIEPAVDETVKEFKE